MADDNKIVVALDLFDPIKTRAIAQKIGEDVFAFKVGWPLILGSNSDIINDLARYAKVICDVNLANIPDINGAITENIREHGAWGIVAHPFAGKDALDAIVKSAGDMKVFSIVAMSHPGSATFIDKSTEEFCALSASSGAYGVMAPGNRIDVLEKVKRLSSQMKVLATGIGAQGGDPLLALKGGADYLVIGRSVYNARDPLRELKRINAVISRLEEEQHAVTNA